LLSAACLQGRPIRTVNVILGEFGVRDYGDNGLLNKDTTVWQPVDQTWLASLTRYLRRTLATRDGVNAPWFWWAWNGAWGPLGWLPVASMCPRAANPWSDGCRLWAAHCCCSVCVRHMWLDHTLLSQRLSAPSAANSGDTKGIVGPTTTWRVVQWTKVRFLSDSMGLKPWYR
jgi:hypothetical protein